MTRADSIRTFRSDVHRARLSGQAKRAEREADRRPEGEATTSPPATNEPHDGSRKRRYLMTEIVWEEPPPRNGRGPKLADQLIPLIDHPKRWALIATRASGGAAGAAAFNINRRRMMLPAGQWEARSAKRPDGTYGIYARYMGEDES
ncbi:MAG: hypothetical protein LC798_03260 [Chloroflexi bacterium]|nr:hypothetical protein [Chloroflexota bacterium]